MHKIGILGGTFNPIHWGHLLLAEQARDTLDFDQVWFIPTGCSYTKEKDSILPGEERFRMVEMAVQDNRLFRCLDIEVNREGATYSYETLEQLRAAYPGDDFYFIVGADCLYSIESWRCVERIFKSCTLVAAIRNGVLWSGLEEKRAELRKRYQCSIILLPFPDIPISSTEVRERIRTGRSVKYLIPENVRMYIEEKGFYREKGSYIS